MLKPEQYHTPQYTPYGSIAEHPRGRKYDDEVKDITDEERHGFLIPPDRRSVMHPPPTLWDRLGKAVTKERVLKVAFWLVLLVLLSLVIARVINQCNKRHHSWHKHHDE